MEQVEVVIKGMVITARYGTLSTGDVLRTDAEFAKHLVEDCQAADYKVIEEKPEVKVEPKKEPKPRKKADPVPPVVTEPDVVTEPEVKTETAEQSTVEAPAAETPNE